MSSEELGWWMAYERLEPFGEDAANWRTAVVMCQTANMNRASKDTKLVMPDEFMKAFFEPDQEYLEEDEEHLEEERHRSIDKALKMGAPKGSLKVYNGEAPHIRRIGKRGKKSKRRDKLDRMIHGKSW